MTHTRFTPLVILVAVLLLAALARTTHLLHESLWLDEGFSYYAITQPDLNGLFGALAADVHPPLYFLLLRGWTALAGDSVLAMRYLSVLFGLLSVALMIPLARELQNGGFSVILAALLLAISDADIYLSREVRMYTLRTMLAVLSVLAYRRWMQTDRRRWWVAWVVSTTALLYTHYLGVFIPLIEGLHALFFLRNRTRLRAIATLFLSSALFLPWLGVTLAQAAEPSSLVVPFAATWETLLDFRNKFFSGQWALMLALALFGLALLVRRRPGLAALLTSWIVLPAALTFIGNTWLPILTDRNVMLITPAIALLVAFGLAQVQGTGRALMVGAILLYSLTTVDFARIKPRWDDVAANATRYAAPGDVMLMEVGADDFPLEYYLDHSLPPSVEARSLRRWRAESGDAYPGELVALLLQRHPIWLAHWSADENILRQLEDNGYTRTATMTTDHLGNALNVYRYDALTGEQVAGFNNGMTLRQVAVHPHRVDLWWSADSPLNADYTVSVFLLDENGVLAAQHDSYPFENARPTTFWLPGEVVYDPHPLTDLPSGRYTVNVKLYTWYDGVIYPTTDGDEWAVVGEWRFTEGG